MLQALGFLTTVGTPDRLGSFFNLAVTREFAPLIVAVVVVGVAGSAITASLGARKVREELDALQVLGVDPVKNLVVPRFLALMIVTAMFDVFTILFGITGGVLASMVQTSRWTILLHLLPAVVDHQPWASVVKCTIYGAIAAIVCCCKGMTASGGAEGVGKAVNQAVVISFIGVFAFNYVFTQTLLATNPDMLIIR